jgi:hypothetical protein
VLEEVGHAGHARPLVGAPHARQPAEGDGGLLVAFHHHEAQAVGEGALDHRDVLGGEGRRRQ